MHNEDRAALYRTVVLMGETVQDADQRFHRDGGVVLRTAAAVDDVGEPVVQNRLCAHTADGKRRRTQQARQRRTPRRELHIADGHEELLVGRTHILIVFLWTLDRNLPSFFILNRHRFMSIRMAADLIPLRSNSAQEVRIVVDIPCDDEKRPVDAVLVQHGKQMIDGVVAPPVIEGEKDRVVRHRLDDARMICPTHLRARKTEHTICLTHLGCTDVAFQELVEKCFARQFGVTDIGLHLLRQCCNVHRIGIEVRTVAQRILHRAYLITRRCTVALCLCIGSARRRVRDIVHLLRLDGTEHISGKSRTRIEIHTQIDDLPAVQ